MSIGKEVHKIGMAVRVTDEEMADAETWCVLMGLAPDPRTPEQKETDRIRYEREREGAIRETDTFLSGLADINDATARFILDLHKPQSRPWSPWRRECSGCDFTGYEAEPVEWPCSTTVALAERFEVEVPERIEWPPDSRR